MYASLARRALTTNITVRSARRHGEQNPIQFVLKTAALKIIKGNVILVRTGQ
jgi:hypothetical protein